MRINGTIDFIELEELKMLLQDIFAGEEIVYKARIIGEEFKIISKSYELCLMSFDPTNQNPMKKPRFSFEGDIKMDKQQSVIEFNRIIKVLNKNKLTYCIAYYPNEKDVKEEIEVISENYWTTFDQMRN